MNMRDYPTLHLDTSLQLSNTLVAADLGIFAVFSSPGPKVHGNYCHHLASVNRDCMVVGFITTYAISAYHH
jgi:hypothetical protein